MPLYETKHKCKVYVAFHVDDNLMIVNLEVLDEAVILLPKNGLVLKVVNGRSIAYLAKQSSHRIRKRLDYVSPSSLGIWRKM